MKAKIKTYIILITVLLCMVPTLTNAQYSGDKNENHTSSKAIILGIVIILDSILCILIGIIWKNKGLSGSGGFWCSLFFSPLFGVLIGIMKLLPSSNHSTSD